LYDVVEHIHTYRAAVLPIFEFFIHFLSQSLAYTMSNNRDKWLATKAMLETHKEIIATAMISDQFRENLPIK
jgi:hypothetical protein